MFDHTSLNNLPYTTQGSGAGLRETQVAPVLMRQGRFFMPKQDIMRSSGGRNTSYEYLVHPGAVVMISPPNGGTVLMERQLRHPVDRVMIESLASKPDPQEGVPARGKRELREEVGYTAERWDYLMRIRSVISYPTELIDIYLVQDPKQGEAMLDEGELSETFITSAGQLIDWVHDGKIPDVKTVISTLWLKKILSDVWTPGAA